MSEADDPVEDYASSEDYCYEADEDVCLPEGDDAVLSEEEASRRVLSEEEAYRRAILESARETGNVASDPTPGEDVLARYALEYDEYVAHSLGSVDSGKDAPDSTRRHQDNVDDFAPGERRTFEAGGRGKDAPENKSPAVAVPQDRGPENARRYGGFLRSKTATGTTTTPRPKTPRDEGWRKDLKKGDLIDARDSEGRWFDAIVAELRNDEIKVHYRGWSARWDAWLNKYSAKEVRPLYAKTHNWRKGLKAGDLCELRGDDPKKALWYEAKVLRVFPAWSEGEEDYVEVQTIALTPQVPRRLPTSSESLCKIGTHIKKSKTKVKPTSSRGKWRTSLRKNDSIDAKDATGRWFDAFVMDVRGDEEIKVHYRGWPRERERWMRRDSEDIQPAFTRTDDWRQQLRKGSHCELTPRRLAEKEAIWFRATVVDVTPATNEREQAYVVVQADLVSSCTRRLPVSSEALCKVGTHIKKELPVVSPDKDSATGRPSFD